MARDRLIGVTARLLAVAAVLAMVVGVLGALAQDDINRLLSFVLVSHIGYMLFGLALFTVDGLTGTVLYTVHHITVQASLFLVAGVTVSMTGTPALRRMRQMAPPPATITVLFLLPALSLAGVPPLSGFVAKLALLRAGVADRAPVVPVLVTAALLTSLLTLYAVARVWARAFWQRPVTELVAKSVHGSAPSDTAAEGNGGRHVAAVRRTEDHGGDGPSDRLSPQTSSRISRR